jgi:hypothetical protein
MPQPTTLLRAPLPYPTPSVTLNTNVQTVLSLSLVKGHYTSRFDRKIHAILAQYVDETRII